MAIGTLAFVLVLGLDALHLVERLDGAIAAFLRHERVFTFQHALPGWAVRLAVALTAYPLAAVMLAVPSVWRRLVLWFSALAFTLAWAPVLALAAYLPQVAGPAIAVAWSGLCALVYSLNHRMASDATIPESTEVSHGPG